MRFERDQVLECVSPTPGLIGGALYVCEGMERVGLWEMVLVKEAHTGRPVGAWWPYRFEAAAYQLGPAPPTGALFPRLVKDGP